MPVFQSKKPRKKRAPKPAAAPPPSPRRAEEEYAANARSFFTGAKSDASGKKCSLAFEKLLNGVSYAGMAEGAAKDRGESGANYAKDTVDAVEAFKRACKLED